MNFSTPMPEYWLGWPCFGSSCEFMSTASLLCPEDIFTAVSSNIGLLQFWPFSQGVSGERGLMQMCRWWLSISHILPALWLVVSFHVNCHHLNKHLMRSEICTNLWIGRQIRLSRAIYVHIHVYFCWNTFHSLFCPRGKTIRIVFKLIKLEEGRRGKKCEGLHWSQPCSRVSLKNNGGTLFSLRPGCVCGSEITLRSSCTLEKIAKGLATELHCQLV